jgi:hypothetical protein
MKERIPHFSPAILFDMVAAGCSHSRVPAGGERPPFSAARLLLEPVP